MTFKEFMGTGGPVAKVGGVIFDIFFVNILWLVLGGPALVLILHILPLGEATGTFTIIDVVSIVLLMIMAGPATCAAFAALGKKQRHEDSYTLKDFWKSYSRNFLQGMGITLLISIVGMMIAYSAWIVLNNSVLFGQMVYVTVPLECLAGVVIILTLTFLYPLLARFEMTSRDLIKNAFIMSVKHLPTTLLCLVLLVGILAATFLWNLGVGFFGVGVYVYVSQLLMERVFRRYLPEEELEKEYLTDDPMAGMTSVRAAVEKADKKSREQVRSDRQAIIDKYTKGKK